MNVSEAVLKRISTRAFLDKEVDLDLLKTILKKSSKAPSGGNLQPWIIYILHNEGLKRFLKFQQQWKGIDVPGYKIYPDNLKEPYKTLKYESGEALYNSIGVKRANRKARLEHVMKNFEFYGAPTALFCFIDRSMGAPQWSDLGMFLQTFMLISEEAGLGTCAQEIWTKKSESVADFLEVPEDLVLFCGMAIGYPDWNASINKFKTSRRELDQWCKFVCK